MTFNLTYITVKKKVKQKLEADYISKNILSPKCFISPEAIAILSVPLMPISRVLLFTLTQVLLTASKII